MAADKSLTPSATEWQAQISDLQAILEEIRPRLVTAEQRLSEQLAQINRFEFEVRARLEPLNRRLEAVEQEIISLQKELRRLRANHIVEAAIEAGDLYAAWRTYEEAGFAAEGDFRYHEAPVRPPQKPLSTDRSNELKELYRQLARRFHPDFALDEADREYRTGIMMAINAAYTAGDWEQLQELAKKPDPQRPAYSDEEMVALLKREVEHIRQRIAEIETELERLLRHPGYLLKQRVDAAARKGRDLLEELASDLRDRIAERMVQRDVLQAEVDDFEFERAEFTDEALADAVFNLGLEQILVDDPDVGLDEWRARNQERLDLEDSDDEEGWEALRRARDRKRR